MDTQTLRSLFIVVVFSLLLTHTFSNDDRQSVLLHTLFTHSSYPSIHFALRQIASLQMDTQLQLNTIDTILPCDVGTSIKSFFDMVNRSSSSSSVLLTDACQNVLNYIAEAATHFYLPIFSFTANDLSLSSFDRYPYLYQIVPSDHSHNLVRQQLLQYFNWTRFGLIYQHGSKYSLVANDFSDLIAMNKKQWELNLTRGIAYRYGSKWTDDNTKNMKTLLTDFKTKDVRIIIANVNQTIATHMFCHAAREDVYGSRYQWIILGYPSSSAWWNEQTHCSKQQLIRAINGTIQTRIPRLSMDHTHEPSSHLLDYFRQFSRLDKDYFDAYAYDSIWSLATIFHSKHLFNQSNIDRIVDHVDFYGATGRVRYLNGRRIGEVLVEQYVACRTMKDGSCQIPCYREENDCNLTVVKNFLVQHSDSKTDLPILSPLNPIIWHGSDPPRDRTVETIQFEHIYLSVFLSITICSVMGLILSISLFGFNLHFRSHRYIRMSSPSLNNLILVGCTFAYISVILIGLNSSLFSHRISIEVLMNIICATRVWFLSISFTLAFGSMFSKTWRVHSIFTNLKTTKKGIHDSRLLAVVGVLLCIDILFLITWQTIDPIRRKLVHDPSYRLQFNQDIEIHPYREECKGRYTPFWFVILILYKGLLMLYGSFLSWTTRHVTISALNDSRYIGLSVYIVFICSALGSLVAFIPSEQIQLSYFLISFFIIICTTATLCLVFLPKINEVYHDPHSKKRQPKFVNRLHYDRSRPFKLTTKHLNNVIIDNQELSFVLSMQEQTLDRLMEQFTTSSIDDIQEPFELERLMVVENGEEEEEEDDSNCDYVSEDNPSPMYKGRVVRTVSLCIYNQIQVVQLCWPEISSSTRYSVPQIANHCQPNTDD